LDVVGTASTTAATYKEKSMTLGLQVSTMPAMDLICKLSDLADDQAEWSQATFGTDEQRGPIGALKHLAKEAIEASENPGDIEEYADCFLLFMDACRRAQFTMPQIVQACKDKMEVNRSRKWPRPTSDEPVEHIEA